MYDIIETVNKWLKEGRRVALATVVETWGSAPRRIGAKMAVTDTMAMIGSVSGGCVEGAVVEEAIDSLNKAKPRLLHYGVSDDTAWEVGLACGGRISIYVEPLDAKWWDAVTRLIHQNCDSATAMIVEGEAAGQKIVVNPNLEAIYEGNLLEVARRDVLLAAAKAAVQRGQSERTKIGELDVLIDVQRVQPRLIIVGGAHVAMALKDFARQLGFRVILIDPRQAFATPERFPDVDMISHSYPDKALLELGLDSQSYITILTHDPKIDDPALRVALPSPAPYIGVLSSKRTHEKRVARLTKAGIDPAQLARIRTPIGLNIGAERPEEIALCIMAEIIAVRNGVLA
jgi:xanthine dehydrogenase accessory factor